MLADKMAGSKMQSAKKLKALQKKRERSLLVRLPTTIRSKEQVAQLFSGNFEVKTRRQASRQCYVLFSSVEEKLENLKAARSKTLNGKHIVVKCIPNTIEKSTKVPKKKIVMPKIPEESKITQALYIANVRCGTKMHELKEALEGCVSVKLLKPYTRTLRSAIVKMENMQIAAEYLAKEREWPVVRGMTLQLYPDTRKKNKKNKSKDSKNSKRKRPVSKKLNTSSNTLDRSDANVQSPSDQSKIRCLTGANWHISKIHITDD